MPANKTLLIAFASHFNTVARHVHQTARDKGWYNNEDSKLLHIIADELPPTAPKTINTLRAIADKIAQRNDGEILALMHSELSEALESLRAGCPPDDKIPEFKGVEAELADVIIRIMDISAARGWRVGEAVAAKIQYNETWPHRHGGKKF